MKRRPFTHDYSDRCHTCREWLARVSSAPSPATLRSKAGARILASRQFATRRRWIHRLSDGVPNAIVR